ncbi:MAG TPA: dihydrodipicolinate synthase family protein [Bryobacteraceae bacterium]|nr:dihydrodipicolinate synthase family protein [Bryobacteraceae bacterium]
MKMGRAARQIRLAGVFAAAVTPNRPGTLDADFSGLLDLLDFLADGKVDGICIAGSTGEFLNYSFSDRQRLVYLGAKRSRVPLIVGVGHSTFTGAVQLAEEAIAGGADALLLMPPYFFRYGQPEIEQFYREFARETGDAVPIMIYNIPQFTSKIEPETARRLLRSGLFAGIKDSSGDWDYFEQLLAFREEHPFALFAGNDRIALRALRAGADGVLSGCACAIPELLVDLHGAAAAGDQAKADALNALLNEFIEWIERFPTPMGIKRAVELRGLKSGQPATPLAPETAALMKDFSDWFRIWLPTCTASR